MALSEYIPINWTIIKHPLNWVIVLLMVLFVAFAADLLLMGVTGGSASDLKTSA